MSLDSRTVFLEKFNFWWYINAGWDQFRTWSLFLRMISQKNGPWTNFSLKWVFHQSRVDFTSDFTPLSLKIHFCPPTQVWAARVGTEEPHAGCSCGTPHSLVLTQPDYFMQHVGSEKTSQTTNPFHNYNDWFCVEILPFQLRQSPTSSLGEKEMEFSVFP